MATRFYLPSSGAAAISPNPDAAWEDTSILARYKCATTKSSSAMTTVSFTDANNTNRDILFRQYVSDPINAQTLQAQTIKYQIRGSQNDIDNNMFSTIGIRVLNNTGSSVTGTVLAVTRDNSELVLTALTNRQFTATSTQVVANQGDRIVIEIGTGGDPANSGSQGHDSDLRIGDAAASDLAENDIAITDDNPWVEFVTDTITFSTAVPRSSTISGGA